jgi:hypothetical protein
MSDFENVNICAKPPMVQAAANGGYEPTLLIFCNAANGGLREPY